MTENPFVAETRAWVERAVIGLKLCPFALAPARKGLIRYAITEAATSETLLENLAIELELIRTSSAEQIETTLLIHPYVLQSFYEYNDFLVVADQLLVSLDLEGEFQIASFHPGYQFYGTDPNDLSNATNRSPYPTLHVLRESSITSAVDAYGNTEAISKTNIATLETLGRQGWQSLQQRCRQDAGRQDTGQEDAGNR